MFTKASENVFYSKYLKSEPRDLHSVETKLEITVKIQPSNGFKQLLGLNPTSLSPSAK